MTLIPTKPKHLVGYGALKERSYNSMSLSISINYAPSCRIKASHLSDCSYVDNIGNDEWCCLYLLPMGFSIGIRFGTPSVFSHACIKHFLTFSNVVLVLSSTFFFVYMSSLDKVSVASYGFILSPRLAFCANLRVFSWVFSLIVWVDSFAFVMRSSWNKYRTLFPNILNLLRHHIVDNILCLELCICTNLKATFTTRNRQRLGLSLNRTAKPF